MQSYDRSQSNSGTSSPFSYPSTSTSKVSLPPASSFFGSNHGSNTFPADITQSEPSSSQSSFINTGTYNYLPNESDHTYSDISPSYNQRYQANYNPPPQEMNYNQMDMYPNQQMPMQQPEYMLGPMMYPNQSNQPPPQQNYHQIDPSWSQDGYMVQHQYDQVIPEPVMQPTPAMDVAPQYPPQNAPYGHGQYSQTNSNNYQMPSGYNDNSYMKKNVQYPIQEMRPQNYHSTSGNGYSNQQTPIVNQNIRPHVNEYTNHHPQQQQIHEYHPSDVTTYHQPITQIPINVYNQQQPASMAYPIVNNQQQIQKATVTQSGYVQPEKSIPKTSRSVSSREQSRVVNPDIEATVIGVIQQQAAQLEEEAKENPTKNVSKKRRFPVVAPPNPSEGLTVKEHLKQKQMEQKRNEKQEKTRQKIIEDEEKRINQRTTTPTVSLSNPVQIAESEIHLRNQTLSNPQNQIPSNPSQMSSQQAYQHHDNLPVQPIQQHSTDQQQPKLHSSQPLNPPSMVYPTSVNPAQIPITSHNNGLMDGTHHYDTQKSINPQTNASFQANSNLNYNSHPLPQPSIPEQPLRQIQEIIRNDEPTPQILQKVDATVKTQENGNIDGPKMNDIPEALEIAPPPKKKRVRKPKPKKPPVVPEVVETVQNENDVTVIKKIVDLQTTVRSLVLTNTALSDEVSRLGYRIQAATEERKILAKRLQHYERNRIRRVTSQRRKRQKEALQTLRNGGIESIGSTHVVDNFSSPASVSITQDNQDYGSDGNGISIDVTAYAYEEMSGKNFAVIVPYTKINGDFVTLDDEGSVNVISSEKKDILESNTIIRKRNTRKRPITESSEENQITKKQKKDEDVGVFMDARRHEELSLMGFDDAEFDDGSLYDSIIAIKSQTTPRKGIFDSTPGSSNASSSRPESRQSDSIGTRSRRSLRNSSRQEF